MKVKETLNLGKTDFPMRAGLPTKEPVWQKEWEEAKLYQRRQELNEGGTTTCRPFWRGRGLLFCMIIF